MVPLGIALAVGPGRAGRRQSARRSRIFRTIFTSTVAISVASASVIWALIYNPSVKVTTWVVDLLHLKTEGLLLDPATALPAVAFMTIWTSLGFNFIIALAGLQGIPQELYESSRIDGASGWQGVPLYHPAAADADAAVPADYLHDQRLPGVYPVQRADRQRRAERLDQRAGLLRCSRSFFKDNRYGFASAIAVVLFVVLLMLSVIQFRLLDRRVHYQ